MMGAGNLRKAATVAAALIVASGGAAAVLALLFGDVRVFTPTFIVVTGVAFLLGLPAYLAAHARRRDTPLVACLSGFIVGAAVPAFVIIIQSAPDQASVDGVATAIKGSFTLAGWLQNLRFIGMFGLLGVGGALLFWFIVRRESRTAKGDADSPSSRRMATLTATAAAVIAAAFVIPYAAEDRSCHNPLRGGKKSIQTAAGFDLQVGTDECPDVEEEVKRFGSAGDWSVRSDVRPDKSFPWLQISLCNEPGTDIFIQGLAQINEVSFSVYQPQGGSSWQSDFRALYDRMHTRWPTKIVFRDGRGNSTDTPSWAAAKKVG